MVSKDNIIEVTSKCICGNGDTENSLKNYFENKCPNCDKEGKLQARTEDNYEVNDDYKGVASVEDSVDNDSQNIKIVCLECRAEYCGQDGYDKNGDLRSGLTTVSPYDITNEDEDEEVSSTEENETTYMSGWEGLCDLLKPLDGEAMMVQRGDYVIIQKIKMPQTARLWAYEGINVVDDSVSITDYTPEIYNTFVVKWGESFENELEFTFNKHKQLFGERKLVVEAKKIQVATDNESGEEDKEESSDENSSGISDTLFGGGKSATDVSNIDTSNIDVGNLDTENLDENSVNGFDNSDENVPETEEVPITNREEAIQFGLTQVGKAKREDGHTIELKVIGNQKWQMGEWCHVKLPSFNEDCYMFISKCGFESSPDSEFINSLTLVDYPPSLGKPSKPTNDEDKEEESDSNTGDTGDDTGNSDESTNGGSTDSNSNDSSDNGNN